MNKQVLQLLEDFYSQKLLRKQIKAATNKLDALILDLSVSYACNLNCKHCYWGDTTLVGNPLSLNEWKTVIEAFYDQGCRHFHFSGKESSLNSQIPQLCKYVKQIDAGNFCGIISNASSNLPFFEAVSNDIDYLEISVDGLPEQHDFIRGAGSFDKMEHNLKQLISWINPEKINLATSLYEGNQSCMPELISRFSPLGITKFFASPILPIGHAKNLSHQLISNEDYSILIQKIHHFLEESEQALNVYFCIQHHTIPDFWQEDAYLRKRFEQFLATAQNVEEKLNNSWLQFSFEFFDLPYLYQMVISSDGYVLPKPDCFHAKNYHELSLGNISTEGLKSILKKRKSAIIQSISS